MDHNTLIIQLCISVGLAVGTSFFCSISEAAFYSIPMGYVEKLKNEGHKSGLYLSKIRDEMQDYIASILILNTLANTYGVYKAGSVSLKLFKDHQTFLSFFPLIMTALILVFAELIPKTLGVHYNRKMAPFLAYPFFVITQLFRFVGLIWLARAVTSIFTKKDDSLAEYSAAELSSIANLSAEEGSIDCRQRNVIQHILELDTHSVRKVMTPRTIVKSLNCNHTIESVLHSTEELPYSRIPVFESERENIIGIVLLQDIYKAFAEGKGAVDIKELIRPVEFIPESMRLDTLLTKFLTQRTHVKIVVDEYGGIAGLVSLEDLLEEVIGEDIIDETDQDVNLREKARDDSHNLQKLKQKETE